MKVCALFKHDIKLIWSVGKSERIIIILVNEYYFFNKYITLYYKHINITVIRFKLEININILLELWTFLEAQITIIFLYR